MKKYTIMEALQLLKEGNKRYISGNLDKKDFSVEKKKKLVADGQNPFAVILSCSDSRVPPEIIFDMGIGDLFVIRVAGNIVDQVVLGSLEYAITVLNIPLIIVLGHENCGAVMATVDETKVSPNIQYIIDRIKPAYLKKRPGVFEVHELYQEIIRENIKESVQKIQVSETISEYVRTQKVKVLGAEYLMKTGQVLFDEHGEFDEAVESDPLILKLNR